MTRTIRPSAADERHRDTIHDALSDPRRRHLVDVLEDRTAAVPFDDLVARIAARERWMDDDRKSEDGTCEDRICEDAVDDIAIGLHHVHLPKLEAAGIVDYDAESRLVVPLHTEEAAGLVRAADGLR